ncbi:NAD(P)/FAD-dependent oxidoreductase [Mongoliibacter ruber]|uniref:Pyridine nucleotide-disulfide oxidoreductase n=1 Tax=Mongoliibacter ruber TaxID=1750599 RepID=A0A2T0WMP1_9BACT|nr:FAD/NAD(P)-binding oxidoreductase [Mongoliibacter ruber]PRY87967.1 pyridine nucleotide-disulfide oxidoreductase [Mongoliibacter ruber]
MNDKNRKIVIIGNGIAGITCARNIRKNDSKTEILVISGESKYFFSRTALMYIYMGHMKYEHTKPYEDWFWEKNNISLKKAWVELINFQKKEILHDSSEKIEYDILVLATGSKPNKYDWPGQDFKGVQGLYSKQDLEEMERNTQDINHAVVVGGGLIGIEMAEMLVSRKIPVTFLVREKNFWDNVLPQDEAKLIGKHILEHHIDLRLETELKEILADENGTVNSIITNKGEKIHCQFVGLAVGVSPNVNFLRDSGLEINRGVLVDHYFQTNQTDVYAIGDCAEFKQAPSKDRKNIEQVWYTGRMHGETLANNLVSSPVAYQPGVWFNSAKFLDIEYQTYGIVPNQSIDELDSFYWEHQTGKNCIRLVYDKSSGKLVGVNSLGWRLRHEFFDLAIQEGWKLEEVLRQLPKADFNAEFFKKHYHQVLEKYEAETGQKIVVSKPSFLKRLIGSRS